MLNFENAQVLALSQESQFLGSVFRYQIRRNLTIEGTLNNLTNFSGASGILQGGDDLFSSDEDYQEVLINGKSFGRGKINSVNLPEGNDVRLKPYTVNITCYLSGDYTSLFNNTFYSGIVSSGASGITPVSDFSNLESFSESFDYTKSENTFGYEHNVELQFNAGYNAQNPIDAAKDLAKTLITNSTPFSFLVSGDTSIGRKLYRESYDVVTNQCSFSESYQRPIDDDLGLIYSITTSFNRDEAGISTVSENGVFELSNPVQNFVELNNPAQELNTFLSGSYGRCLSLFSSYSGANTYPLYTGYTSLSKNLTPHESAGNYSISFTNNPAQLSGVSWEYTHEISKADRYFNVVENGTVIAHGNPRVNFPKAKAICNGLEYGSYGRIYSFYTGNVDIPYAIYKTTEEKTTSEFNGTVSYSFAYTDDPSYGTVDSMIKTQDISVEDTIPMQSVNSFNIFNFKEILQPVNNATIGSRSVSISLVGQPGVTLQYFKNYSKNKANEFIPSGDNTFLNSVTYTHTPNTKNFELNAVWSFFDTAKTII